MEIIPCLTGAALLLSLDVWLLESRRVGILNKVFVDLVAVLVVPYWKGMSWKPVYSTDMCVLFAIPCRACFDPTQVLCTPICTNQGSSPSHAFYNRPPRPWCSSWAWWAKQKAWLYMFNMQAVALYIPSMTAVLLQVSEYLQRFCWPKGQHKRNMNYKPIYKRALNRKPRVDTHFSSVRIWSGVNQPDFTFSEFSRRFSIMTVTSLMNFPSPSLKTMIPYQMVLLKTGNIECFLLFDLPHYKHSHPSLSNSNFSKRARRLSRECPPANHMLWMSCGTLSLPLGFFSQSRRSRASTIAYLRRASAWSWDWSSAASEEPLALEDGAWVELRVVTTSI